MIEEEKDLPFMRIFVIYGTGGNYITTQVVQHNKEYLKAQVVSEQNTPSMTSF